VKRREGGRAYCFRNSARGMHTVEEGLIAGELRCRLSPELLQRLACAVPIQVESHRIDCEPTVIKTLS